MRQLLPFLAAVAVAALIGASFGPDAWYEALEKPVFQPPSWLFGPVWTVLYIAMAVAAWRVWRAGRPGRGAALTLWTVQLALNALWSPLFFGYHLVAVALVNIVALAVLVLGTLAVFARHDRRAAWLLAPYLAWIAFATLLNASLLVLNGP